MAKTTKTKKRTQKRPAGRRPAIPPVQSPFALPGDELERMLLTGEGRGLAEDYFGPQQYAELRDLAHDAATRSVRGGPVVLILPGIMGSTIGKKGLLGDNVLWIDPLEIARGRIVELKVNGSTAYRAVGVILLAYLKLKLRLKIAGFDARFHPFDWRFGLDTLGAQLAATINKDPAKQISLVAHSMGGLVARAALPQTKDKVRKLIMLGTPNHGSFAPVQVIRGTYDIVLKVAAVDLHHTAEQLSSQVFNTFPGLYQMLPAPEKFNVVDLYDAAAWPAKGPQPRPALLSSVKGVIRKLAPADSRFFLVAGVNQDTVTGLQRVDNEFTYQVSMDGDGTVPLAFARLDGLTTSQIYYVEEGHGSLPNNNAVGRAVQDLLAEGTTAALSREVPALRRAARTLSEPELRAAAARAVPPGQLGTADFRHLLDSVAAPDRSETAMTAMGTEAAAVTAAAPGSTAALSHEFRNLVVGRRRQQRLEITLAHGSITDVETRAYVLGIFRNVAPSGAANAIDRVLNGAISEFTVRRMFAGNVGEVFTMPMGRNGVRADMVMLAGLGPFDRFNGEVQQLVAENVIRTLVRGRIDEFATVLMGNSSGQSIAFALQNLLIGFIRGLRDVDPKRRFRGITLCETDPTRFAQMREELFRLTSTPLFEDTEVILDEIELPPSPAAAAVRGVQRSVDPIYLMVRQETGARGKMQFRSSMLGAGLKAAVVTSICDVEEKKLSAALSAFDREMAAGGNADTSAAGTLFGSLMLPEDVRAAIEAMRDRHLVIVHDAPAARIPWETLSINGWRPALEAGLSRRYLADNLSIATWLQQRRDDPVLNVLLITNPTLDLDGAEAEGERIHALARAVPGVKITEYRGAQATKPAILAALRSGVFDVVHYAGHAFFDPQTPGRSGLICAGRQVLSGTDVAGISNLPCAVFFNACEAGRVRAATARNTPPASKRVQESFGVAEALMRGGISNYLSTYWPVSDLPAAKFAETFYTDILAGKPIGDAVLAGRKAVQTAGSRDWADYILYGSSDFVLKSGADSGGG